MQTNIKNNIGTSVVCPESYKAEFKNSRCVVIISVGNEAHEGDRFIATLQRVNRHFKECDIAVNDSLQRNTMQITDLNSESEVHQKANQAGADWIKRNEHAFSQLTIPYSIFRWDEYITQPDFQNSKTIVENAYETDDAFKLAMHSSINQYITRNQKKIGDKLVDEKRVFKLCFKYLIEECAVIMLMWAEKNYNFIIYSSNMIDVMQAAHKKFVEPTSPHLLRWVRIKLKTKLKKETPDSINSTTEIADTQTPFDINIYQLLDNMPLNVYWKDINGIYLGCNLTQARNVGFKHPRNIIGKTDFELGLKKGVAQIYWDNDQAVMKSGVPKVVEEPTLFDGEMVIVLSHKVPIYDDNNKIIGLMGISFDLSKHKETEKRLTQEKDHAVIALENVIARLPGHVYWKDTNNIFLGCNDLQALSAGLQSRKEIAGKTDYDMPWKDQADKLHAIDEEVRKTGIEHSIEETSKLANGREAIFLSKKTPLFDQHGDTIGILGISFDITKQKKIEKELIQARENAEFADQVKTDFINNMEHDIRTPFNGLLGIAKILIQKESDPEKKELLYSMANCANELLDYFNGILNFSKIEAKSIPLLSKTFNLETTIYRIITMEIPPAKLKNLNLSVEYHKDLPKIVISDPYRIQRIFINLISNAIKFTKKGFIKVSIQPTEKKYKARHVIVKFAVEDSGIGIPEDKKDLIYESFTRADPSNKGLYKGQGLGLRIVKQFVDELDGDIHLQSELGKGSTFTLFLPLKIPLSDQIIDEEYDLNQAHA